MATFARVGDVISSPRSTTEPWCSEEEMAAMDAPRSETAGELPRRMRGLEKR